MSKGEERVASVLRQGGCRFVREKSFPGLVGRSGRSLRFDFWLPDCRTAIEFNGKQHYFAVKKFGGEMGLRRQQHNDMKKRVYCLKNGITLLVIPYYDENKIDLDYIDNLMGGESWRL